MSNKKIINTRYSLAIFIIVVLASGWIGVFIDSFIPNQPKGNSLGMGIWLLLPILTMLLLRFINSDWKDIGVKPNFRGNIKWYLVSILIYPLITIITVCLGLLLDCIFVSAIKWSALFTIIAISIGSNFIKNIFEEFSWRGYLTPKLIELKVNDWLIYLISGLIWALWHSAYYLIFLPDNYFEFNSRVETLLIGCVLMVSWSIMYVEIYRLTNSVWPGVLMHAIEDGIPTVLITVSSIIAFTNKADFWLNPISGVIATLLFTIIGILLRQKRIQNIQKISL